MLDINSNTLLNDDELSSSCLKSGFNSLDTSQSTLVNSRIETQSTSHSLSILNDIESHDFCNFEFNSHNSVHNVPIICMSCENLHNNLKCVEQQKKTVVDEVQGLLGILDSSVKESRLLKTSLHSVLQEQEEARAFHDATFHEFTEVCKDNDRLSKECGFLWDFIASRGINASDVHDFIIQCSQQSLQSRSDNDLVDENENELLKPIKRCITKSAI